MIQKTPIQNPTSLLKGLGRGEFEEILHAGLALRSSRPVEVVPSGDLDNDGGIDIVVINRDVSGSRFAHISGTPDRHWVMFRVQSRNGIDALEQRAEDPSWGSCSVASGKSE